MKVFASSSSIGTTGGIACGVLGLGLHSSIASAEPAEGDIFSSTSGYLRKLAKPSDVVEDIGTAVSN